MTAKYNFLIASLFILFYTSLTAQSYKMTITDAEVLSSTKIQVNVYIENMGEELILTSYQCAFSINQNIDLSSLSLTYVEESSELLNEPNLFVGVEYLDGPAELTFVSYIGNDIISQKTLVGTFTFEGNSDICDINGLNINWDFEGAIATIITGENFQNITNPSNHLSDCTTEGPSEIDQVNIIDSKASAVFEDLFTDKQLYDGITSSTTNSDTEGRWAVEGFPNWVTFDLGEETLVEYIKIDPFGSENGISYDCEFYYGEYNSKTLILKETTQTGNQWSHHDLGGISARYITIVVTGSEGNLWCDFWEVEIYGHKITDINEDNTEEEMTELNNEIPSEYGISQNYPNPFNPSTNVVINMKKNENVKLDVYNLLGEKVMSLLDGNLSAGVHEISIDGSNLASGLYIYQLVVGNEFSESRKMQLMK